MELNTGKIIWKNSTLTPVRATPTLVDNKVIILTLDNRTLVFEKEDGSLIWEHQGIQNTTSIIGEPKVAEGSSSSALIQMEKSLPLNLTNEESVKQISVNIEQSETIELFSDIDTNLVI